MRIASVARGVQSIHVKKCWLVVRCNIWEISSWTFWIIASSVRFCLFNDVDIVKSSRNERNFLFVCFEANGSLRSSKAEENWSIIVTKLSPNCVWMANNEGGRVSIKLPGPGQSRSLRPWSWVDGVTRWGKIQHEKLSQPLPPPFLNHGTDSWLSRIYILKQKGQEKRKYLVDKPVFIFAEIIESFMVQ